MNFTLVRLVTVLCIMIHFIATVADLTICQTSSGRMLSATLITFLSSLVSVHRFRFFPRIVSGALFLHCSVCVASHCIHVAALTEQLLSLRFHSLRCSAQSNSLIQVQILLLQ